MKFLKYRHRLREHCRLPAVLALTLLLFDMYLCAQPYDDGRLTRTGAAILVVVLPLALYIALLLICNGLTNEEREKISNSKPVRWEVAAAQQLEAARIASSFCNIFWIFLFVFETIPQLAVAIKLRHWALSLCIALPVYLITLLCCIYEKRKAAFWAKIDQTAEVALLPIDRLFLRRIYGGRQRRGVVRQRAFGVCYLPDGKYVFKANAQHLDRKTVVLVRFQGKYMYYLQSDADESEA